ncbi:hypothetical protein TSAR_002004, partial [Trichomalopsis sarcophagae]
SGTTSPISRKFDIHIYFWILHLGKKSFLIFLTIFFNSHFFDFRKRLFSDFFNHQNKTTYFYSFGSMIRPFCSADKIKYDDFFSKSHISETKHHTLTKNSCR